MAELDVRVVRGSADDIRAPLVVMHRFERDDALAGVAAALDARLGGHISRVLERGDFAGRKDETLVLYPSATDAPVERVLLVGVGKAEDFTVERLRRAVGQSMRQAERMRVADVGMLLGFTRRTSEHMGDYFAALAAVEAAVLAQWEFLELKRPSDERPAPVESFTLFATTADQERDFRRAAHHGSVTARAANLARDLATRPGNVATPTFLAETAQSIGTDHGLEVTVLDRAGIRAEGLHALLAVAQGTEEEPRFIVLEHRRGPKDAKPLVIIGKGVTFDSGGISIKPAERMEEMKYDMSGAAATLGAMRGIGELGIEANVVGIVPATENMPDGRAMKPGDVIRSHLGKTIEVVNTDAEGRLVLADALSYARRFEPAAMIDAATLTGAVVIGLGHHAIGLMGNHGDLIDEVRAVGLRVGERCWPLPLWDEYRQQIDSPIADVKNSGGRPAGSITAGWFLKEFAGETPWVHLDIAGTAWRDEAAPYLRKGATGVPTRLFIEWVRARAEG